MDDDEVAGDDGVARIVDGDSNGSGVIRIGCVCVYIE